ncbi:helicase [Winogradskyella psychrotolerans]|uniref:primase-helicase family protein n=1 Tax=Winogradskyella psychrotolerans TaxID=1344585 RepID=UPI001C07E22E|nr:DUF5906 domain-containing protein [Winogradskyella psychrotolerans]MBU2921493.1 helicase [Winogradskyella psychrotolerans]
MEYLRIGTDYYKKIKKPLPNGGFSDELVRWKKAEIITDKGKDYINKIEKYDGFTNSPSHTNFKQKIDNFYNRYHKLEHEFVAGDFNTIKLFLKHIFKNHYELAIDYLTIIWKYPKQVLPILCLTSSERNTGKTTFLYFLKLIFKNNLTINTNDDFRGRFNSDWTYKTLICIDEVLLQKREDSERLKHLSTAKSYKAESKGVDKVEIPFFGKFILCTNNEDSFINIDEEEIRYWVIKVEPFKEEIPNLIKTLESELKHFMFYLNTRKIKTKQKTRMWFSPEEIKTDALLVLKKGNQNSVVREIKELLLDEFDKFEVNELYYTATDLVNKLKDLNFRTTSSRVSYIIKNHFKIPYINSSYKKYYISENPLDNSMIVGSNNFKGRFYTFRKEDL